ncbi:GTA-gp10 family protein [Brevundimonas variabilis]|uniref:Uncharacterized protein n=1 Tax=Brevundimonas variabilis TaxID=74312 RepID=A0A7W9CJM9_9CAUL|nr:GTA-gp10 family protein [Brevundimonas variabilis]MBB5746889.1 hypothetical protein [Brevundimonas variabilis]
MIPVNGVRGEVAVVLAGADRRLCLTLGALAEIETALGLQGLEGLGGRMRVLSASDLGRVLAALLRGGGEDADLALRAGPAEAARAIVSAFEAAAR